MFLVRNTFMALALSALAGAEVITMTSPTSVLNDGDGNPSSPWMADGINPLQLRVDTAAIIPAGSVLNSVTVRIAGNAIDASYRGEIDLTLTSPSESAQSWDFGSQLGFPNSPGSYDSGNLTATALSGNASGVFTLSITEDYNDAGNDNQVTSLALVINFTAPDTGTSTPMAAYLNGVFPATDPLSGGAQPPATLSATGAFSSLSNLTATAGLIPYEVNSPLWSDGARKERWIAIPNDGQHDTAAEQVVFAADQPWTFPVGTVAVKHFELPIDARNPSLVRRLETRFLVAIGGGNFYGVTYRWRADGSDADLLPDGASDIITLINSDGSSRSQTWDYPSRLDCRSCHNLGAGVFLGVNTWQLNGEMAYPGESVLRNQLTAWAEREIFTTPLADPTTYPRAVAVDDASASLENRVRSYLAANCASCHSPFGDLNASFDLRFGTSLSDTGLINGSLLYPLGIADAVAIAPGDPARSIVHRRMNTTDVHKMPPIGRNVIDADAVLALNQWIMTLSPTIGGDSNPPIASADDALTRQGVSVAINALSNDSDVDGDSFQYLQSSPPAHGTISWNTTTGIVTYTPAASYLGSDSFTYQIIDSTGAVSEPATVSIVVTAAATANSVAFTDSSSLLPDSNSYSGVAMGVADMNQDGLDDIVRLKDARNLFIDYQNRNSSFSSLSLGRVSTSFQWGIALGDTDNNGFADIITGGFNDGLHYLRASSNGSGFTSTTLSSPLIFLQAVNFADINGDGWLDLFPCHDLGLTPPFRNQGDGNLVYDASLINTATTPSSDNSGNYGSVWTDYDGDGDLDLYIAKCRAGVTSPTDPRRVNQLFRNDGDGNYTEVAAAAGMADGTQSWTSDFADIDNDGDLDCFIGNHSGASKLMRNNGNGTFTEVTSSGGISVSWNVIQSIFRDFNNDGWIDLLLAGESQELWLNDRDGTFTKSPNPFTAAAMESCAVGDLNNDGFPDIYAGYATLYNTPEAARPDRLFLNTPNGNGFLSIRLKGRTSNRLASGARLELHGPWGIQVREVRSGEGYGITNSFSQRFGMGNVATATKLVVKWPSGTVDTAYNLAANQFLLLEEGDTQAPTLAPVANRVTGSSSAVNLALIATDPDGNALTFGATGLPTGLSINASSGLISGKTASVGGTFAPTVTVTDGWSTASSSFTWTITPPVNNPPVLANPGSQLAEVGDLISLTLTASDPEGQVLNYTASGLPTGLTLNAATGLIAGTATTGETLTTVIIASDGTNTVSESFTWTVEIPFVDPGLAYSGLRPILPTRIQVEDFDTGPAGVSYSDVNEGNIGGVYRQTDVDLEASQDTDGTPSLGWTEDGEWLQYSIQLAPGTWDIAARAASEFGTPGSLRVLLDNELLGSIDIRGTGGWYAWQDFVLPAVTITGTEAATLRLEIVGAAFNLNWIEFREPGSTGTGNSGGGQTPYGGAAATIPGRVQAEFFDEGASGVSHLDLDPENIGRAFRDSSVDLERSYDVDDSFSIGWIENSEWTEYTLEVTPGTYDITARIASAVVAPGLIRVLLDGRELGLITVVGTSDWSLWQDATLANVAITESGSAVLRLEYIGGPYNLNWVQFTESAGPGAGGEALGQRPFFGVPASVPGRIQAENYDLGGEGIAYQDNELLNLTGAYRSDGVDIEPSYDIDNSLSLGWFRANEWVEYTIAPQGGTYTVTIRISAGKSNPGDLRLSLDGTVLGTFDIPDTGGPHTWASVSLADIVIPDGGPQVLRIEAVGDGVNLNWVEFARTGSAPGGQEGIREELSTESLLATAFGSWFGDPLEQQAPQVTLSHDGENPFCAITFLIRLGGWQTGTGYATNEINYEPQCSTNLIHWSEHLRKIDNPSGLPVPPAGFKFVTYQLPGGEFPKAFFRVAVDAK